MRSSATIPQLLRDVIAIMTSHALVERESDVISVLHDIKALNRKAYSSRLDDLDIIESYYYNDWWKENLADCTASDMMPKSSVKDVMDLVDDFFSVLVRHQHSDHFSFLISHRHSHHRRTT